jgi:hypothetical protein
VGQNNIIELNGKQYDALTGAFLGESRIKATPASRAAQPHRGRAIDGVMRGNKHAAALAPTVIKPTPAIVVAAPAPAPKKPSNKRMDIQRVHKHVKAHQPERAKTLMRHAVSKPKTEMKTAIKMTAPTEMMAKPASELAKPLEKKVSVTQVNPVRLARARQVAKSHHIRRYHHSAAQQHAIAATPAQARPVQRPAQYAARPVAKAETVVSQSAVLQRAAKQQASKQHATDIFEAALAHANSHQEPLQRNNGRRAKSRRRFVSVAAGLATFLVIGGFIAYLNMPGIELRVASIQAGFHAQMPSYSPNGYALDGGIKSSDGFVEMTYRSGTSSYTIKQEVSDWNSATLLDQNTEQRGAPTRTVQSKGRIIYLYDNATATWVNSGVHYEITGDAALDTDELVSLATSM